MLLKRIYIPILELAQVAHPDCGNVAQWLKNVKCKSTDNRNHASLSISGFVNIPWRKLTLVYAAAKPAKPAIKNPLPGGGSGFVTVTLRRQFA